MPYRARGFEVHRGGRRILALGELALPAEGAVAFTGPNGAGKTTLLEAFAGLLPFRGELACRGLSLPPEGEFPPAARRAIAFVPARPHLFRVSLLENAALPLRARGISRRAAEEAAAGVLDRVGLLALAGRPAEALSAGETKRAALARALAADPETLLLDEPTAHVDEVSARVIESLLADFAARPGRALLLATHDLPLALGVAGRHFAVIPGGLTAGPYLNHEAGTRVDPAAVRLVAAEDPAAAARGVVVGSRLVGARALVALALEPDGRRLEALLPDPALAPPPGARVGARFERLAVGRL